MENKTYYLGIDSGGTKTAFAICDEDGRIISRTTVPSVSIAQCGKEKARDILSEGIGHLVAQAQITVKQIQSVCFGASCYGEDYANDRELCKISKEILGSVPIIFVNDAEVAWAGSLGMEPGITVVAGTGSIAFGKDETGKTARCGGFSEHFDDAGSGYWLGLKTLSLFCQQADGRCPKSPLYDLVREHLSLNNNYGINGVFKKEFSFSRERVASLQMLLYKAARAGDMAAIEIYRQAAHELLKLVNGVQKQLCYERETLVSFSGGIFQVGCLIVDPFMELAELSGYKVQEPVATPLNGALMIAAETSPIGKKIIDTLKKQNS
mgnify:CR=1 FL=1